MASSMASSRTSSSELRPEDLVSYFSPSTSPSPKTHKRAATHSASRGGSYDSTITDFNAEEAERAAMEILENGVEETLSASARPWDDLRRCLDARPLKNAHRQAIARKLIDNHCLVLRDICNECPTTQLQLKRLPPSAARHADAALREVARRLCGKSAEVKSIPAEQIDMRSPPAQVQAWSSLATYLSGRIQSRDNERPGRAPDMSPESAELLRAVLQQLWFEAYEIQRRRG